MIKIINGVYGKKEGNRVIPVTANDGPFELTPEQEARLVKRGVAVYVDKPKDTPTLSQQVNTDGNTEDRLPDYNEDMTREQLNQIAEIYGIAEPQKVRNKTELIALLDAAKAGELNDDEELPPSFDAADAVGD